MTYLRPEHLDKQLNWAESQDKVNKIVVGHLENDLTPEFDFQGYEVLRWKQDPGIKSTFINCTVHPAETDFVLLLNDDILPGQDYLDFVSNCYRKNPGAYGAFGMNLTGNYYDRFFPKAENNEEIVEVDAIGQSYFFPVEYLGYYFSETMPKDWTSSDDLWFSYQLAKNNKPRYIPPHPVGSPEKWAIKNNLASNDSTKKKLHKRNPEHKKHRTEIINYWKENI